MPKKQNITPSILVTISILFESNFLRIFSDLMHVRKHILWLNGVIYISKRKHAVSQMRTTNVSVYSPCLARLQLRPDLSYQSPLSSADRASPVIGTQDRTIRVSIQSFLKAEKNVITSCCFTVYERTNAGKVFVSY
jgi:hypothetical protein